MTFHDREGTKFKAKSDMIMFNTITNKRVYIELKPSPCNTVSTIRTSNNNCSYQCQRFDLSTQGSHYTLSNRLVQSGNRAAQNAGFTNSWSNSIVKQSVVASAVSEAGDEFLLVFENHSLAKLKIRQTQFTLSDYYRTKYGINAIYATDLEEMIESGLLVPIAVN